MPELDGILNGLEDRFGPRAGCPVPLDGGITNRNYRVDFGGRSYVVRLPGKDTGLLGIDRSAEELAARQAASLGIGPAFRHGDGACSVTEFVDASPFTPEALRADPGPVARALRAFHRSGLTLPVRFWVPDLLDDYAALLQGRSVAPPPAFERARALVARIAGVLPLTAPVPCHDDLLIGNLLWTGERALLVDWEYAGMGHHLFDLGNLAVNNGFDDAAQERLLEAYDGRRATPGRRAGLRLMRIVSDAREAAWGVVQGVLSDLDFDFGAYAEEHFERLDAAAADPRLQEDLDAATA